jgi:hypothetical protein
MRDNGKPKRDTDQGNYPADSWVAEGFVFVPRYSEAHKYDAKYPENDQDGGGNV